MDSVGMLVARGADHPGALRHALAHLTACPDGLHKDKFEPANVERVCVRGFGPFGCMMVRFRTNEQTLRRWCSREDRLRLEQTVNSTAADSDRKMDLVVTEAAPLWHLDPVVTQRIYICHGEESHESGSTLQRLLAILSSDPMIDIASYDSIMSNGHFTEAWRINDWAGRGKWWLDDYAHVANLLSWGPRHGVHPDRGTVPEMLQYWPSDFMRFASATLHLGDPAQIVDEGYVYFQLHVPDRRGLFAFVDRYARTTLIPSGFPPRQVIRSACRGMGGHGIVLVAVPGTLKLADLMSSGLQAALEEHDAMAAMRGWNNHLIQGRAVWDKQLLVTHSHVPPTALGNTSKRAIETVKFVASSNEPGTLLEICDTAWQSVGADATIYYLDARNKDETKASCVIGWAMPEDSRTSFRRVMRPLIKRRSDSQPSPEWNPE